SIYDGEAARFTPESVSRIQAQLGSDIAMCLDAVPPADAPRQALEEAVRLTTLWAARQPSAERAPGQLLSGIAQAGTAVELRTRLGRTGSALTWEGRLNLKNARYARDQAPLQEDCGCPACTRFSRAYIRHLVNQQELLGHRLLSLHNLRFLLDLTADARAAI